MAGSAWFLEGRIDRGQKLLRVPVQPLPFSIGRGTASDLVLESKLVSMQHAELRMLGEELWLEDLGSTNGTFVNSDRLSEPRRVDDADLLHFGDLEFRLERSKAVDMVSTGQTLSLSSDDLPLPLFGKSREFRVMLRERDLRALFQPVVRIDDGAVLAYEALGRGLVDGVEWGPKDLFFIAAQLGLAAELSTLFRAEALASTGPLLPSAAIFVNTHPAELEDDEALLASLRRERRRHPNRQIVLEIHESAVTDLRALKSLRAALEELAIGVAFDDFGTGQARLLELSEVEPQYVKFDAVWIKEIDRTTAKRRELLGTLVRLVADMEIHAIAEGVETEEEAAACLDLGFLYAQGFYFGRPAPALSLAPTVTSDQVG